jgi:hypothetical protein
LTEILDEGSSDEEDGSGGSESESGDSEEENEGSYFFYQAHQDVKVFHFGEVQHLQTSK